MAWSLRAVGGGVAVDGLGTELCCVVEIAEGDVGCAQEPATPFMRLVREETGGNASHGRAGPLPPRAGSGAHPSPSLCAPGSTSARHARERCTQARVDRRSGVDSTESHADDVAVPVRRLRWLDGVGPGRQVHNDLLAGKVCSGLTVPGAVHPRIDEQARTTPSEGRGSAE
jgi:hypothetical protein